jgi:hypothetical protein
MEDYIQYLQNRLKSQSSESNLRKLIDNEMRILSNTITTLQEEQIMQHKGFDDKPLFSLFNDGTYSLKTEKIAESQGIFSKTAGSPYNFKWTDEFVQGLTVAKVGNNWNITSTGIQGLDKIDFFEGYVNMFGLDTENSLMIIGELYSNVLEQVMMSVYE